MHFRPHTCTLLGQLKQNTSAGSYSLSLLSLYGISAEGITAVEGMICKTTSMWHLGSYILAYLFTLEIGRPYLMVKLGPAAIPS